jgi:hypothetical protein
MIKIPNGGTLKVQSPVRCITIELVRSITIELVRSIEKCAMIIARRSISSHAGCARYLENSIRMYECLVTLPTLLSALLFCHRQAEQFKPYSMPGVGQ